jgi:hypothetical protein
MPLVSTPPVSRNSARYDAASIPQVLTHDTRVSFVCEGVRVTRKLPSCGLPGNPQVLTHE